MKTNTIMKWFISLLKKDKKIFLKEFNNTHQNIDKFNLKKMLNLIIKNK